MPTATVICCRQCGHRSDSECATGEFRCPACDWRELRATAARTEEPARRPRAGAAAAPAAAAREENHVMSSTASASRRVATDADSDGAAMDAGAAIDLLPAMTHDELVHWCGRMFQRFGYSVGLADGSDRDADIELGEGQDLVLVECRSADDDRVVGKVDCQRLVGAMVGRAARRAILITAGAFDDAARAFAASITDSDLRLDLIDESELHATVEALAHGPLHKWMHPSWR
jgi:hypothetical protein